MMTFLAVVGIIALFFLVLYVVCGLYIAVTFDTSLRDQFTWWRESRKLKREQRKGL
jgi:hypothetical protein